MRESLEGDCCPLEVLSHAHHGAANIVVYMQTGVHY